MHRFVLKDNEILGERRNKTKWREISTSFVSYMINDGLMNLSITALKNDRKYILKGFANSNNFKVEFLQLIIKRKSYLINIQIERIV